MGTTFFKPLSLGKEEKAGGIHLESICLNIFFSPNSPNVFHVIFILILSSIFWWYRVDYYIKANITHGRKAPLQPPRHL